MWFRKKEEIREPFISLKELMETKPVYWTLNSNGDALRCSLDISIWGSYSDLKKTFEKIYGITTERGVLECNKTEAKFIAPVINKLLKDKQEERSKKLEEKDEVNRIKTTELLQNHLQNS